MSEQMTLPWEVASELDRLLRALNADKRLTRVSVEHRMATSDGWVEGWHASAGVMTDSVNGRGPCVLLASSDDGPVEAMVAVLRKAAQHIEVTRK